MDVAQIWVVKAKSAEVDAIPIVRPQGGGPREPLVIPTHKDSPHYILESGVKQVIIFNQKKFAQRLGLGTIQIWETLNST